MAPQQPSKKTEQKAKDKIIEDRTFGLKNKNKSSKVQKYVQQVAQQIKSGGNPKAKKEEAKSLARKQKKEEEEIRKQEASLLAKPVVSAQKVPFGTDPKSVVCQYFKVGLCTKGDKCKFSHDLNIGRKSAKADLYTDSRTEQSFTTSDQQETMENWDQAKLETVVHTKHNSGKNSPTTTDIICKYFLEAVENRKYGWFWECPSGGDLCKYRHALPSGYVLKPKQIQEIEDTEEQSSLEEFLEIERHKITGTLTPITEESFKKWKKERTKKEEEISQLKQADIRAGRVLASGKELFVMNPELFQQDDEGAMEEQYLADRQQDQDIDLDSNSKKDMNEDVELNAINTELFLDEELAELEIEQVQ